MDFEQENNAERIAAAFEQAAARYRVFGVDAGAAVEQALAIPVSLHCWQADDVRGLEVRDNAVDGGGLLATGSCPGAARNGEECRRDLEEVLALSPGCHRINLHASYAETGGARVDRDALQPDHFETWMQWAQDRGLALDFNPTFFAHRLSSDGWTLTHPVAAVREFWIAHGTACLHIASAMGRRQGSPCVVNIWIPDGAKDLPANRWTPRERLVQALDDLFGRAAHAGAEARIETVESKLFGLGSEEYVAGSFEFYCAYALSRNKIPCLDTGHFHPTESIADKLSALLQFHPQLLLHLSRPVRWDSDHVVLFDDAVRAVLHEVARGEAWDRVLLATDFFDAGINRIGAYVIGARAVRKAILYALLEPRAALLELEQQGRGARKLALMEECKTLPFGAVWDQACRQAGVPAGAHWIQGMETYERTVLRERQ